MNRRSQLVDEYKKLALELHKLKLNNKRMPQKKKQKQKQKYPNAVKPKTFDTVSKNLQQSNNKIRRTKNVHPYVLCRLSPFSGNSYNFTGLPDGDNSRRIVMDHTSFVDIAFSAGTLTIRCLPTLPFMSVIQASPNATFSIEDPVLGASGAGWGNNSPNVWIPCNGVNAYLQQMIVNSLLQSITGPYAQTKCRMLGMAWRLIYSGTVTAASGLITVRDFPFTIDSIQEMPPNGLRVSNNNNQSTGLINLFTPVAVVDFPTQSASSDVGMSRILRLDQNPWGVCKHNSQIYAWYPYWEQQVQLISSANTLSQIQNSATTPITGILTQSGTGNSNLGFNVIDPEFNSTEIKITSISGPCTFRFEVKQCWEYVVQPTSPIYSMTKTAPPKNAEAIKHVDRVLQAAPPGLAYNETLGPR